jgi:filamentous hemagglutinin
MVVTTITKPTSEPRSICDLSGVRAGWAVIAGLALMLGAAAAAAAPPKLPTVCFNTNCGTSAQSFVQYGSAGAVYSGSTLTVTQSTSKAILNWADFNIANGFKVSFVQPSSTAAVLNKIWSSDPSIIAGALQANGQVYLYNQNGIVFDKGAQINTAGLTAATLALPDSLFEDGILSGNTAGQPPPAAFVAPPNGAPGAISVNQGATLTTSDGGRIMLLGSAVTNQGSITTPDGQTILGAATKNVYLAASTDPSLRGLLIEVDGGGITGTVTNSGQISAPRGNITLAGLIVNQKGALSATTSVGENGSIYLVAGDTSGSTPIYNPNPTQNSAPTAFGGLLPNNGGTLILSPGSTTQVLPDATDTGTLTVPQQAAFITSQVDLAGRAVALNGNATIKAPGGSVNVYAAGDPALQGSNPTLPPADGGSIYLDKASVIDVAGLSQVSVPVTQNIVQVTLETNDLQNDPLQRNSFLHGTTVTADIRNPPALFDITPYANNIGSNIDEVLTKGGNIQLNATGNVVARAGSTLNVSGGSIAYQSAYGPATTNLVGADGKIYNIGTAPNTVEYVGVANSYSYTDATWGVTTKGAAQTLYAGYTQGANAGGLQVKAPAVYLRGTMLADTVNGINQRSPGSLAAGGTFSVGCANCTDESKLPNYGLDGGVSFSNDLEDNLNANIIFDGSVISATNVPALTLISPAQLTASGFNQISVYSNGAVALPAGTPVSLAPMGALTLVSGGPMDVAGRITAPGGSVLLQTSKGSDGLDHPITLAAGAVIDVSGGWINDSPLVTLQPGTAPTVINGGSIALSAAGDVVLGANTLLNVSGGGWVNVNNVLSEGTAGKISLSADYSVQPLNPATSPFTGAVIISSGASLQGASLKPAGGGSLSLLSGSVTVGSTLADTPGEILLRPSFFTQGGFAHYNIVGLNDLIIGNLKDQSDSAPVTIAPAQQTLVFSGNSMLEPTGTSVASFTHLTTLDPAYRSPASVSFASNASDLGGAEIGDVTLARDASIVTDPGATVTLSVLGYNGSLRDYGTIEAPAGSINLVLENQPGGIQFGQDPGYIADQQILLGPNAVLAAPAYANINTLNKYGYREGSVLAGGTITVAANKGFVVTDLGSLINVSGTAGIIDVINSNGVTPTTVAGNGGTINLDAREGMVLQGSLLGQAATLNGAPVSGAGGGTLNVELGYGYDYGVFAPLNQTSAAQYPTNPRILTLVGQTNGRPAEPFTNQLQSGAAFINEGTLSSGGFENLSVQSSDSIAFAGAVALRVDGGLTLDAPAFLASNGTQVALNAGYAALGNYFNTSDYFNSSYPSPNASAVLNPTAGPGTISVSARLIDIRGISGWNGFAQEDFASSGDIRFVSGANLIEEPPAVGVAGNTSFEGALNTSATLLLESAQLYPTTATGFAINDVPENSSSSPGSAVSAAAPTAVFIGSPAGAATPAMPLAAGGSIAINATEITQAGVLRAPMGEISLNGVSVLDSSGNVVTPGSVTLAGGSLTSVSSDGQTLPLGATANGTQWTYSPASQVTDVLTAPPAKQVSLTGATVTVASGAKGDLSGGGDLYAYEFIAGQGGSVDVLNPANLPAANHPAGTTVYSYAILPSLGSAYAPFDPQYAQGQITGQPPSALGQLSVGATITLSGVPGLAAGTYTLLPARYALLPGAYAIQVVQQNSGIAAGSSVEQAFGSYLVAGRFGIAGTAVEDSLTSTVLVASDSVVRSQAQYTDTYGNVFFSTLATLDHNAAPPLPADAGQLALSATNELTLNGSVNLAAGSYVSGETTSGAPIVQQGLGGAVAITAQNLLVVDSAANQAPAGTVELDVHQLDNLNAQTLILGATASSTSTGEQLNVGSTQTVELKNTAALSAPQIILAAQDSVTVDPDARVSAGNLSGGPNPVAGNFLLPGGGALLQVSSGAASTLNVDPTTLPPTPTGTVSVGSAGNIAATGSLLLYGTNTTTLTPGAKISAPAVSLYSSVVSLGEVPTGTAGLVLTPELLGTLKGLTNLTLGSSSTINLYGAVALGTAASGTPNLSSITLDSGGIGGYLAGDKVFRAGNITLTNTAALPAGAFAQTPDGSGALELIAASALKGTPSNPAGQITLGPNAKTVSGFSTLDLAADGDIVTQGAGTLNVASNASAPVDLNFTAAALIGSAAANQSITTSGAVTLLRSKNGAGLTLPAPGLGAALSVTGSSIEQDGSIDLPAGTVTLTATSGNVNLGAGSTTAAAGAYQNYTVTDAAAAAGQVSLIANTGSVAIKAGASVDVSGVAAPSGKVAAGAGTLNVSAPLGTFAYAGSTLKGAAPAGQEQGNFGLDVGSGLAGTNFATLASALAASGFTGAIDLRTHGDAAVTIANAVHASSFELSADAGTIEVTGSGLIDTSGGSALDSNGGSIALWAGSGLTLDGGAQLLANAGAAGPMGTNATTLAAHGGNITLGTASGQLSILGNAARPTTISMQGGGGADTDGTLALRAPRTADNANVQVSVQSGINVDSRNPVIVEGFKTYTAADLGSTDNSCGAAGSSCDIADLAGVLFTDAAAFTASMGALPANLAGLATIQVRPGIEIDSPVSAANPYGDLVLDNSVAAWDLASWNAALGTPVNVTLRAAGNLVLQSSLSDGFTNNNKTLPKWVFGEPAGAGPGSATYRLAAGADLTAANPLAVVAQAAPDTSLGAAPNAGNVIVTPGVLIRTGRGDIDIAAGGDLLLGYAYNGRDALGMLQVSESDPQTSAIYTAGVPAAPVSTSLFEPTNLSRNGGGTPAYPVDGGNISIAAADDVRSAISAELVTDWQWRRGTSGGTLSPKSTASWWIMFNLFTQGIGALGGGDVALSAGRDIVNTSAVIPTTGRQLVPTAGAAPAYSDLLLTGGGNLSVHAGGDIISGVFQDDWGNASIAAGGAIKSSSNSTIGQQFPNVASSYLPAADTEVYPILAVGNGVFDVSGNAGIEFDGVTNATSLPLTVANQKAVFNINGDVGFYSYAPDANPSTLNLVSAGGSVTLNANPLANLGIVALSRNGVIYETSPNAVNYLSIYPSTLNVAALSGDVNLGDSELAQVIPNQVNLILFPSASGNLSILAAGAVNNDGLSYVAQLSEVNPLLAPNALAPQGVRSFTGLDGIAEPLTPLHQGDTQPVIVAAESGDIGTGAMIFPKAADVIAAGNIVELDYSGKNLNPSDVTLISAGGNITYSTPTQPITNQLVQNIDGIQVAGPGYAEVLAGGTIDLGDGNGILTSGNLADPRLPSSGASMIVGAGFGNNADGTLRQPAYQAFINAYLAPTAGTPSPYASTLVAYMQQLYPAAGANLSYSQALTAFDALTRPQQLPLLTNVLDNELSETGLDHTKNGASYDRGYTAINTLFPNKDSQGNALTYNGDLDMFFSQLKTEQGGGIGLLVPGGSVVVGEPNPPANLSAIKGFTTATGLTVPGSVNLGILVLAQGAIEGFADQNFDVNQSRILTLEGGDIILWASNGNIDAGKGAKSASGAPPPTIQTDANGNLFVNPSNAVSGSGIGQLLTVPGITAGLVNLIAPKGTVNAGDAGIRVAGNLNIAAVQVLGASNITVVGTSSGVPVSEAGALAGALSGANSLGDSSKNVVSQLSQDLASSTNYQQLTDSLAPAFIVVKEFCLGVECETH